jgi:hypothetical protein
VIIIIESHGADRETVAEIVPDRITSSEIPKLSTEIRGGSDHVRRVR